jgi:hypothetical protein
MRSRSVDVGVAVICFLLALDGAAVHSRGDETAVSVVAVARGERCLPLSPSDPVRAPNSEGLVFLELELGGSATRHQSVLDPESAQLRSGDSLWRPESVTIGMPVGDPLGLRTRGPILLFQIPRRIDRFRLKVRDEAEVEVRLVGAIQHTLQCR